MPRSQLTITRPANVDPYSPGDVIGQDSGAVIRFANLNARPGFDLLITSARLLIGTIGLPAGMTTFRLHLYSGTPASSLADNAPWDLSPMDRPNHVGFVDLGLPQVLGDTLGFQVDGVGKQVKLSATDTGLYGYLVTSGGFTPAAPSTPYQLTLFAMPV